MTTLVAGIDSSTQSCKVVIRDADSGELVRSGRAPHPPGTEVAPAAWWSALQAAVEHAGGLDDVAAVSVAAQQHGMVLLDDDGEVLRDALLWNDTRSAPQAAQLVEDLGGREPWADAVGLVPLAAYTASKLRWVADQEPEVADRVAAVCLPHDWLSWRLQADRSLDTLATDRSDASGTAYYSAAQSRYRPDLVSLALRGRTPRLPRVAGPSEVVGHTSGGAAIGPGAGDNAAAALALGAGEGDLVVSLGTSGVVSATTDVALHDPRGLVAGFADATGRQLPLVCTLNGAPVLGTVARMLGVDVDELSGLALSASPGADGVVLAPWFAGERTPDLPTAHASLHGLTDDNATPANIARAAVEGLICSLVTSASNLTWNGVAARQVLLVGGGARSEAVRTIAPSLFGLPVAIPRPGEYVADGAAVQAAWVASGADAPPRWHDEPASVQTAELQATTIERYVDVTVHAATAFPEPE